MLLRNIGSNFQDYMAPKLRRIQSTGKSVETFERFLFEPQTGMCIIHEFRSVTREKHLEGWTRPLYNNIYSTVYHPNIFHHSHEQMRIILLKTEQKCHLTRFHIFVNISSRRRSVIITFSINLEHKELGLQS